MRFRRIVSLSLLISFIFLILTGVILYIMPAGRVAYWSGWRLWGLSKTQWTAFHINLSLLFLLSGILHTYYNWNPIVSYLRNRVRRVVIFTWEFTIAVVVALLVLLTTHFGLPPLQWMLDLNESVKDAASLRYGEPPYGHAELSTLETFLRRVSIDSDSAFSRLSREGVHVSDPAQTVAELAAAHHLTPQQLYDAMRPSGPAAGAAPGLPLAPPPGTGRRTVADLCATYQLDVDHIMDALRAQGIQGTHETAIKDLAAQNESSPDSIYELIRLAADR